MTARTLNGKYRILDIIDNRIIIRDYNDIDNTRDYIMSLETGEVLFTGKEISAYKNGYIVEKDNNKIVYIDNNLDEKTKEFDYINMLHINDGVLMCGDNNDDNTREYSLYDINGNKLTNYTYKAMGDENKNAKDKKYYCGGHSKGGNLSIYAPFKIDDSINHWTYRVISSNEKSENYLPDFNEITITVSYLLNDKIEFSKVTFEKSDFQS